MMNDYEYHDLSAVSSMVTIHTVGYYLTYHLQDYALFQAAVVIRHLVYPLY